MKIIFFRDQAFFWQLLESYLKSINARDIISAGRDDITEALQGGANLVLTEGSLAGHEALASLRAPLIVIGDSDMPPDTSGDRRKTHHLPWPCTKKTFLEVTAAALNLEPRKDFRSLVRISRRGETASQVGESRDFSLTGMCFQSTAFFAAGMRITISFSPPNLEQSLLLEGRVARLVKNDGGDERLYGMEFTGMDHSTKELLKDFILT